MSGLQLPGQIGQEPEKQITLEFLRDLLIHTQGVDVAKKSRKWRHVKERAFFVEAAYAEGYKQDEIAAFLGHKDHSTVSRYLNNFNRFGKLRPNL